MTNPKPFPVLGTIYNVVSLAAPFVLLWGVFGDYPQLVALSLIMIIPTIVLPETKGYREYWSKFE